MIPMRDIADDYYDFDEKNLNKKKKNKKKYYFNPSLLFHILK